MLKCFMSINAQIDMTKLQLYKKKNLDEKSDKAIH